MRSSRLLRCSVLAAIVAALPACASSVMKGGAVGAGGVRLEPTLDPNTKRPILLPVPTPDLSNDTARAIKELGVRPGRDSLRESPPERPSLPGLGYDTTQGIQSQNLEKALGR